MYVFVNQDIWHFVQGICEYLSNIAPEALKSHVSSAHLPSCIEEGKRCQKDNWKKERV